LPVEGLLLPVAARLLTPAGDILMACSCHQGTEVP
jgi:hypothetical protein